ncbi:MAG: MotA/TolQ/ExbB proton channel family protein [Planctomycetota bacterium]
MNQNDQHFESNPLAARSHSGPFDPSDSPDNSGAAGLVSVVAGLVVSGLFYAGAIFIPWEPLQRYFLGHPVAIAATILFWIAASTLTVKWLQTASQWRLLSRIRDVDLVPPARTNPTSPTQTATPDQAYFQDRDVQRVAQGWLSHLKQLPGSTHSSRLVQRLQEVLDRQVRRGTSKHLADDLREIAGREADHAHDSFGLVRIIVWAIPMLGFLGTVIGITQTLGGLDFTDGTEAVDRLKSGLYVAFDTTALGLVLSVVAIFLQFPVERSEQQLMNVIDGRVGPMISATLPNDDAANDPTRLIVDLCEGIKIAVASSISQQTQLWRQTIDEANQYWKQSHAADADRFAHVVNATLKPALDGHADSLQDSVRLAGESLQSSTSDWQATLDQSLRQLSEGQTTAMLGQTEMIALQNQLIKHSENLALLYHQTDKLQTQQASLDSNLERLATTNEAVERTLQSAAKESMPEAMLVLARAVDVLSGRLANDKNADFQLKRAA